MMPRQRSAAMLATWRRAVDVAKAWAIPDTSAAQ
jgi:hypothetical protein